jgi:hypothetical protein
MNTSNATLVYYTVDELLINNAGSTWFLDYFNFYPFIVVGSLGSLLNILAFIVFMDAEFSIPLYSYMRMYCINNFLMCFLQIFNFAYVSFRLFPWGNSYWAQAYYDFVYSNISSVFYFFGSMLDIVILVDRIANFNKKVKERLTNLSPYKVGFIVLAVCIVVDTPAFIFYMPGKLVAQINATATFTVWFSTTTPLANTPIGAAFVYACYGLRDVGVMAIQIFLNLVSMFYLKQFLNKKKRMTEGGLGVRNATVSQAVKSQNPVTITAGFKRDTKGRSVSAVSSRDHISSADQKATLMVFNLIQSIVKNIYTPFCFNAPYLFL